AARGEQARDRLADAARGATHDRGAAGEVEQGFAHVGESIRAGMLRSYLATDPPEPAMSSRRVLITGAGSGLGRGLALRYARAGDRVACVDLVGERAAE